MKENADIKVSQSGSTSLITAAGELDLRNSKEFKQALEYGAQHSELVTVDLRRAEYVDSAILQAIIEVYSALRKKDGNMRLLVQADSHPAHVLKTVGFDDLIEVVVDTTAPSASASQEGQN